MSAGYQLPGNGETIDLQQQVARLQALLEASRQVHSTIHEDEVLEQILRIVVRELEMAGAAFLGTDLSYGDLPIDPETGLDADSESEPVPVTAASGLTSYLLENREGRADGGVSGGGAGWT
jgi:hypothetical protein